jgi:hypothetical protein
MVRRSRGAGPGRFGPVSLVAVCKFSAIATAATANRRECYFERCNATMSQLRPIVNRSTSGCTKYGASTYRRNEHHAAMICSSHGAHSGARVAVDRGRSRLVFGRGRALAWSTMGSLDPRSWPDWAQSPRGNVDGGGGLDELEVHETLAMIVFWISGQRKGLGALDLRSMGPEQGCNRNGVQISSAGARVYPASARSRPAPSCAAGRRRIPHRSIFLGLCLSGSSDTNNLAPEVPSDQPPPRDGVTLNRSRRSSQVPFLRLGGKTPTLRAQTGKRGRVRVQGRRR